MAMPAQKPSTSKQDYETPDDFVAAVVRRFGPIDVDLACHAHTSKGVIGITPKEDSLSVAWCQWYDDTLWLNPEFNNIAVWAEKCAEEARFMRRGRILMLTPASVGTNWYADHVFNKAMTLALSPRMIFKGEKDPYPKDLMLTVWGQAYCGFGTWRWK
jgi:hypothetical protein